MLDRYLSEIDYNIAAMMACGPCATYLVSYSNFMTVCATTEEKIEYWQENNKGRVELNHVRIFHKENDYEIFGNIEVFGVQGMPSVVQPVVSLKNDAKKF
ncbi:hypothetical protein NQ317_005362 [Molorchus minor]|uniref:Uncharacterized protein n=1 Tax=Molorchus minor TaxID=1323400 RepID=A0ABQ9IR27_9CUCU|nr:hypothetical protein NQ317_005362 [Molorchus minor]